MQALLRAGELANFRGQYAPPAMLLNLTIAHGLLRAQSPLPRLIEFCFARLADVRAASGMGSTPSPLGCSCRLRLPKTQSTLEACLLACFRVTVGAWGTLWGPPTPPGPAVRSHGSTALHWAAFHDNRRIVRLLIASKAALNVPNRDGCAFSLWHRVRRPRPAVCRAGARRCTMPRAMARPKRSKNCSCAAPPWLSRTTTGNAALRCTANRLHCRARAGGRRSKTQNVMGRSRNTRWRKGRCTQHAASAPPPTGLVPLRRRSPSAYADRGGRQLPSRHGPALAP